MLRRSLPTHAAPAAATRSRRVVAALLLAGALTGLASSDAQSETLTPRAAADYRDSVGVQMHHDFTGYAYDTESSSTLGGLLRQVGISHVRDSACVSGGQRCANVQAKLAKLRDALGPGAPSVDLMLLTTAELATTPGRAARDAQIQRALTAAANPALRPMVAGIEGVNEPDLKGTAGWEQLTAGDEATTDALLAQPEFASLRSVRRLSPALGRAANTHSLLGSGWRPRPGQTGNFHPYPPAWGGPEHGLTVGCGTQLVTDCVSKLSGESGGAPIATESGYSTTGGPISTSWVSEQAQATYLPRLLLENFDRGIARTYLYELIDLDPAGTAVNHGYGLWRARRTASGIGVGAAKPAASALARTHEVIGDLGGTRPALTPIELAITVEGRSVTSSQLRRTLLQRADGSYVLALWQPKAAFDNTVFRQRDLAVADVSAELTFGGSWNARAVRPTRSSSTVAALEHGARVAVPVGADVTLIELQQLAHGSLPPADAGTVTPPQTANVSTSGVRLGAAASAKAKVAVPSTSKAKAAAKAKKAKAKKAKARAKRAKTKRAKARAAARARTAGRR